MVSTWGIEPHFWRDHGCKAQIWEKTSTGWGRAWRLRMLCFQPTWLWWTNERSNREREEDRGRCLAGIWTLNHHCFFSLSLLMQLPLYLFIFPKQLCARSYYVTSLIYPLPSLVYNVYTLVLGLMPAESKKLVIFIFNIVSFS